MRWNKEALLLVLSFLLHCVPAVAQTRVVHDPSRIDAGFLYVYHSSENPETFTATKDRMYLYIASPDAIETVTRSSIGASFSVRVGRQVMDWSYMTFKEDSSQAFLPKDFVLDPRVSMSVRTLFLRDFAGSTMRYEIDNIFGDRPETLLAPDRSVGETSIDPVKLPVFSMHGLNQDFWLAARFLDHSKTTVLNVSRSGYTLQAKFLPGPVETLKYEGKSYRCRKFEIIPSGLIGHLFGKRGALWIDLDSGFNFVVKSRNENPPLQEFMLAERRAMNLAEWEAFKAEMVKGTR